MSEIELGKPFWYDLTVENAAEIVPFYEAVCDWKAQRHDMGDYADFDMMAPNGEKAAGICHAKGDNRGLPPTWLMYVPVASLKDALASVRTYGGAVVHDRYDSFAVIRDPAGAHLALWEQRPE